MPAIRIDPAVLMGQSAEMTGLTADYDHLFQSVASSLTTMNTRWSANLANNFSSRITSAKSVFAGLTDLLNLGAQAALVSANDFLSIDNSIGMAVSGAATGVSKVIDQMKIIGDYLKGRTVEDIVWEQLKRYKKTSDIFEEISAIFGEDNVLGELPGVDEISKIDKIFKVFKPGDWSPASIIEKGKALFQLFGGKDLITKGTGLTDPEAGLVIDLVTAEAKNHAENTIENVTLVYQMLTDKNMSFSDKLKAAQYIANNGWNKSQMEGLRDVIYDKADDIGLIAGVQKYIQHASNGEFTTVSDVYRGYFETMKYTASELGVAEMLKINAESFWETLHEPWFGWKDFLNL